MTAPDRTPSAVEEEALARFVAATSGEADARDRHDLQRWLDADPDHRRHFAQLTEIAAEIDALRPLFPAPPAPRFRLRTWGAAAGLAAATAAVLIVSLPGLQVAARPTRPETVNLDDGSRIAIDAGGAIELSRLPWSRTVTLRGGAAVFDVVHNRTHPFVVRVDGVTVTDIGTRFLIRATPGRTLVAVFDGEVAVTAADDQVTRLTAHQAAEIIDGAARPVTAPDEGEATDWTQGRLVFNDTPLAEAATKLSRYRDIPIIVGEPAIAGWKVSGAFTLDNQDEAIRALEMILPITARHDAGRISLMPRRPIPSR